MLENAVLYARIILLALPFNVLQLLFQSFCVTAEKPRLGLTVTVMSGVTNMVMDAVLVMLLPQEYKLAGAAAGRATARCLPIPPEGGILYPRLTRTHKPDSASFRRFLPFSS